MDPPVPPNLTKYSTHPSLLLPQPPSQQPNPNSTSVPALSSQDLATLTSAIFHTRLLCYSTAEDLFISLDTSNPTVVLEYGLALLAQGAYTPAEHLLSRYITLKDPSKQATTAAHTRAINLLFALVRCFTKASFVEAWEQIKSAYSWLKGVTEAEVREFTDMDVECVGLYFQLLMIASVVGISFPLWKYGNVLSVMGEWVRRRDGGVWSWKDGIRGLREWLQQEGRLMEAYQVLRKEVILAEDKVGCIESFLRACHGLEGQIGGGEINTGDHPIWWLEGNAMLLLADYLAHSTVEGYQRALQLILTAKEIFGTFDLEGYTSSQLQLKTRYSRMILTNSPHASQRTEETFNQWHSLREAFKEYNNPFHQYQCLKHSITLCDELSKTLPHDSSKWNDTFLIKCTELQTHQMYSMGDFYQLFSDYITIMAFRALTISSGVAAVHEWLQNFEQDYGFGPGKYEFWQLRMAKCRWMYQYVVLVGDMEIMPDIMSEAMAVQQEEVAFWADESFDDGVVLQARVSVSCAGQERDCSGDGVEEDEEDESNWLIKILASGFHFQVDTHTSLLAVGVGNTVSSPVWQNMLRRMRIEHSSGDLSSDLVRAMLNLEIQPPELPRYDNIHGLLSSLDEFSFQRLVLVRDGKPIETDLWILAFEAFKTWLNPQNTASRGSTSKRHWLLLSLAFERKAIVPLEDTSMSLNAAQAIIDLGPHLWPSIRENFYKPAVPFCRDTVAGLTLQAALSPNLDPVQSTTIFAISEDMYEQAANEFIQLGNIDGASRVFQNLSRLFLLIKLKGIHIPGLDLTGEGLRHLLKAEKLQNIVQRGVAIMQGWEGIEGFLTRKKMVEKKGNLAYNVHDMAVGHLWSMPLDGTQSQKEHRDLLLWQWIQRGKASALVEFMGIGGIMSARLWNSVSDPKARELLQEERDIEKRLAAAVHIDIPALRSRQEKIRDELKEFKECESYLAAMEGTPFTFSDSEAILDASKGVSGKGSVDVFFVDWYIEPEKVLGSVITDEKITMTVLKAGSNVPVAWSLDISEHVVLQWAEEQLNVPDLQRYDSTFELRRLDVLVQPLSNITKPGDILIFCPTKILHRIPLHALKLDGETIIRRNPVVYTQSLSLLRYAFLSMKGGGHKGEIVKNSRVLVFGDPPTQIGHVAILKTATIFDAVAHVGVESTKQNFVDSLNDPENGPSVVHFHGHCWFSDESPFEHCLQFANREMLTAGEVFDLRGGAGVGDEEGERTKVEHSGYHVTMIACGSGLSEISKSDNNLGLVPAWLYSGASSTVSTLWPIDDVDGARFSEGFYESWAGDGGVVNLAKAVQRAVVNLLDRWNEEKQLSGRGAAGWDELPVYHWGGFVLHGWWMRSNGGI